MWSQERHFSRNLIISDENFKNFERDFFVIKHFYLYQLLELWQQCYKPKHITHYGPVKKKGMSSTNISLHWHLCKTSKLRLFSNFTVFTSDRDIFSPIPSPHLDEKFSNYRNNLMAL